MPEPLPVLSSISYPWLDAAACVDMELGEFFVDAGKAIKEETREVCRGCPVRVQCLTHAYTQNIGAGYFGGLSPSQRRTLSLAQALAFIAKDTPEHPIGVDQPQVD
jgi:WhiB family redox-sensing transcriptional regulator